MRGTDDTLLNVNRQVAGGDRQRLGRVAPLDFPTLLLTHAGAPDGGAGTVLGCVDGNMMSKHFWL